MSRSDSGLELLGTSAPLILETSENGVLIPHTDALFKGQLLRVGEDLWILGEDGVKIVVRDYFDAAGGVELWSANGARLSPEMVASLVGPLAPGQYAQAGGIDPAIAIGQVA